MIQRSTRRFTFFLLMALLLFSGCRETSMPSWQIDDIRETVFRFQFSQFEHAMAACRKTSCHKNNVGAIYLSLEGFEGKDMMNTNPSVAFMGRFSRHMPPIRKVSDCLCTDRIRDKKTGKPGLLFYISDTKKVSDTAFDVDGGYYEGDLSASGNTYRVELVRGRWKVTKDTMHWLS